MKNIEQHGQVSGSEVSNFPIDGEQPKDKYQFSEQHESQNQARSDALILFNPKHVCLLHEASDVSKELIEQLLETNDIELAIAKVKESLKLKDKFDDAKHSQKVSE